AEAGERGVAPVLDLSTEHQSCKLAHHVIGDARTLHAFLQRDADEHLARGVQVLNLVIGVADLPEPRSKIVQVRSGGVMDFEDRAAGELDRVMQALGGEEIHRGQERQHGDDVEDQRIPHERYGSPDLEELHRKSGSDPEEKVSGSDPDSQTTAPSCSSRPRSLRVAALTNCSRLAPSHMRSGLATSTAEEMPKQ